MSYLAFFLLANLIDIKAMVCFSEIENKIKKDRPRVSGLQEKPGKARNEGVSVHRRS